MKTIFLLLGLALLICFGLRMFGVGENIIHTDKQWLSLLGFGLLFSIIGFVIESYQIVPLSTYQLQNKRMRIRSCWYCILLLAPLIILLFFL